MNQMIQAFDPDGREIYITKDEWRERVLPGELHRQRANPDALYQVIVQAVQDGFAKDVLKASQELLALDRNKERACCLRGIVLMKNGMLDQAEALFQEYLKKIGASAYVLTNLAKVYAERKDHERAHQTLLQSLRLDPNQENALDWWAGIQSDKNGEAGYVRAMAEIARFPGAWRPRLWLARIALQQGDLKTALAHYQAILQVKDIPDVALMQISGDLGQRGHLTEILSLVAPLYRPEVHRVEVGLNLLQCRLEMRQRREGLELLSRLSRLNRPDLNPVLRRYQESFQALP